MPAISPFCHATDRPFSSMLFCFGSSIGSSTPARRARGPDRTVPAAVFEPS
jgi:hypothetical protein